jgi:hypothetical protein
VIANTQQIVYSVIPLMEQPQTGIQKPPSNWLERNLKWFVPVVVITGFVGVIGGFALTLFTVMRSTDAYKGAVARARDDDAVMQTLGTPIREGWIVTGSFHVSGPSGNADLAIPISGPKGDAEIYVEAKKSLGQWQFLHLIVEIQKTGQRIDLSDDKSTLRSGTE